MASPKAPLKVAISGAAGQIGYALIPLVCTGQMFGADQPVELALLDIPQMVDSLKGVEMEIEDGAYPLVRGVVCTADPNVAFKGVQWVVLIGGFPRKKGMERKDLLGMNGKIFIGQGKALGENADPDVRVLVVANPANTNAYVLMKNAIAANPKIKKENITALTRLDMNRAKTMIGKKLGHNNAIVDGVKNVVIFGNHSATQFPYTGIAKYGNDQDVKQAINDEKWLEDFIVKVQKRGAAVIEARGLSSAMSAANAAKDHVHDWYFGTKPGEYVSMAVYSKGNPYGIDEDLIYSFPVSISADHEWTIHQIAAEKIGDDDKKRMVATETELKEERSDVADSVSRL